MKFAHKFDLKAVDRLNLARLYEIPSFIRPAFISLCRITLKISDLPSIDIQKIGLPAFSVHAPGVDSLPTNEECNKLTHSTVCLRVWKKEWWSKIGRGILQPVPIFAWDFPDDVVEAVQKLQLPGVTPARPSELIDDGVQELERLLSVGAL